MLLLSGLDHDGAPHATPHSPFAGLSMRIAVSPSALRFAACCAAISAVTTFLLWLLPRMVTPPEDFAATIALHRSVWYLARWWVNFAHTWLALFAYLGAAALLAGRSLALAVAGAVSFFVWAVTELVGVSVIIFAVNRTWRAAYETAGAEGQATLRTLLAGWDATWDAMFFLLLVAFLLGSLFFGIAAARGRGLERLVGALLLAAVPLTALIMAGGYAGAGWADGITAAVYPALQPVSRLLMGVWIWREAQGLDVG